MGHILKYSSWQSPSGYWYCNDVSDLSGISGYWWVPARMLGITPADFVALLIEKYQPDNISFDGKTLLYSWKEENYSKMNSFLLWINREARNRKFYC